MAREHRVAGDLDASSAVKERPVFQELAECGEDVTLDMGKVEFIDSSGVGAIVFLYKRLLEAKRTLRVTNLQGQPLQLLTYLRLTDLFADKALARASR